MQQRFSKSVTVLVRLVGIVWILGGTAGLLVAALFSKDRGIFVAAGAFFLSSGIGLLVVKSPSSTDTDRFGKLFDKMKRRHR